MIKLCLQYWMMLRTYLYSTLGKCKSLGSIHIPNNTTIATCHNFQEFWEQIKYVNISPKYSCLKGFATFWEFSFHRQ